ncbi:MAG TPA: HAMP domain-containing sensor histidine kinase [Candidatus Polarisedimenticolia bacterium]|nr:HAMP domain-containing sensor histidine kinase [Candidatus Polarisedimenticolia bacterium]
MLREYFRRHTLWICFAAVLVPLLFMLGMQFVWLGHLKEASALAHKAALHTLLETVGTEVQYFYRAAAERALNLSPSIFDSTGQRLEEAAWYWKKKPVPAARRLFLADFTRSEFGNFLFYDPDDHSLKRPLASDESMAIVMAASPWQMVRLGSVGKGFSLIVDERSPDYRIILNPIVDEHRGIVGVAGMVLDEKYFRKELLTPIIRKTMTTFFPTSGADDKTILVRDRGGQIVVAYGAGDGKGETVTARFPFVFADWTMDFTSARNMPEELASASFAFNLSLSILLALTLLGALAFAFRSAGKAMKLSEMKSDFVSNVSHELRTPLASIRVFAELLRLGRVKSPEKVQVYGEYIEAESRRLTGLINNILDFARIESGRKTYSFCRVDVGEVVASVLRSFEIRLAPEGYRIRFEGPEKPITPVDLDPDAISQAVHNLLDNAVKYSGDAKEIAVRLDQDGEWLLISVQDHGIGIAREEQKKIFERFHRVSTGLVHDVKGSGLGLSIVHHIVQAHGGDVCVESEPGRGSRFTLILPMTQPGRGGAAARAPEGAAIPGLQREA